MIEPYKKPTAIRAFNVVQGMLGGKNPLSTSALIASAQRKSGLKNFGDDFAEESFQQLVSAINTEARLHPFGRFMIKEKLVSQLENRLWAEHWYQKYPEILEEEVLPVLLISGLQRTGTTKLQRLLSLQEGARGLMSWEALYPAPLKKEKETKTRVSMTRRNERAVRYISPVFHAIHPIHTDSQEEDVLLMDLNFQGTSAEAIMQVPSYAEWLDKQDPRDAYRAEAKLLKLLQWQRGGKYWVLKSPHHLEYLSEMNAELPIKGVVWMHRDIQLCVASFMSMLYYSRAMFSDEVDPKEIIDHWIPKIGRMLKNGNAFKDSNEDLFLDLQFDELMSNPGEALLKIGARFNNTIPGDPMIPEDKYRSSHKYRKSDWQIPEDLWTEAFKDYEQRGKI